MGSVGLDGVGGEGYDCGVDDCVLGHFRGGDKFENIAVVVFAVW